MASTFSHASHAPLTPATDAVALERLRTQPGVETERLLEILEALPTPEARQDRLIGEHRLALSLPALSAWMQAARQERDERRFREFLSDVQRAAERAEAFRELLAGAERLHQVNVALLAARLFDALVARDANAIETLAHTFAEVIRATHHSQRPCKNNERDLVGGPTAPGGRHPPRNRARGSVSTPPERR